MKTWAIILILWVAPAIMLLIAILRANMRKAARRRAEENAQLRLAQKRGKQAPAD